MANYDIRTIKKIYSNNNPNEETPQKAKKSSINII